MWNVVCIENQYRFIDTTWSSGYVANNVFNQLFSSYWFLTLPIDFIETHLPKNPTDQHLVPAMTKGEFLRRPQATAAFYKHRMKILPPHDTDVIEANNEFSFEIVVPSPKFFTHNQARLIVCMLPFPFFSFVLIGLCCCPSSGISRIQRMTTPRGPWAPLSKETGLPYFTSQSHSQRRETSC